MPIDKYKPNFIHSMKCSNCNGHGIDVVVKTTKKCHQTMKSLVGISFRIKMKTIDARKLGKRLRVKKKFTHEISTRLSQTTFNKFSFVFKASINPKGLVIHSNPRSYEASKTKRKSKAFRQEKKQSNRVLSYIFSSEDYCMPREEMRNVSGFIRDFENSVASVFQMKSMSYSSFSTAHLRRDPQISQVTLTPNITKD
ncbi:hypothetical protein DICVIV_05776 [Dictyocaulus viviparus]|uniref:Uncharacterized protein n=1 Tax=Dictyocaulus viviparus TaxID=29172 RepID=A0A0D8XWD0_DICVI|nr:hypothetical protein DICVIV_05776 [Dictyocaulus viviparus]